MGAGHVKLNLSFIFEFVFYLLVRPRGETLGYSQMINIDIGCKKKSTSPKITKNNMCHGENHPWFVSIFVIIGLY